MTQKITTRAQAIAGGLPYYFTGKSCRNGHVAKRATLTGGCYDCLLAAGKAYRKRTRDTIRANKPRK
jgi:hypothetical protein